MMIERLDHQEVLAELCGLLGRTVTVSMIPPDGGSVRFQGILKRTVEYEGSGLFFQVLPELSLVAHLQPDPNGFALPLSCEGAWLTDWDLAIRSDTRSKRVQTADEFLAAATLFINPDDGTHSEQYERADEIMDLLVERLFSEGV